MARLTKEDLAAESEAEVDIGGGKTVLIHRKDLITMFLEGLIPMPLLSAIQRLIEQAPTFLSDPSQMGNFDEADRIRVLEMLRRYVVAITQDPLFAMPDEKGEVPAGYANVARLTTQQLIAIWTRANALMGVDDTGGVAAKDVADRFREAERGPDIPALPSRPDIRPVPELVVDSGIGERKYG